MVREKKEDMTDLRREYRRARGLCLGIQVMSACALAIPLGRARTIIPLFCASWCVNVELEAVFAACASRVSRCVSCILTASLAMRSSWGKRVTHHRYFLVCRSRDLWSGRLSARQLRSKHAKCSKREAPSIDVRSKEAPRTEHQGMRLCSDRTSCRDT